MTNAQSAVLVTGRHTECIFTTRLNHESTEFDNFNVTLHMNEHIQLCNKEANKIDSATTYES